MSDVPATEGGTSRGAGRFVVFEGLDGAGTTTQLGRLADHLRARGLAVEATREPTSGPLGVVLRQAIDGRLVLDRVAMALAFAADRADHLANPANGVLPTLASGRWVLSDRYVLSSLAYQVGAGLDEAWVRAINAHATAPDLTIFVDTPPEQCLARIEARSGHAELFHTEAALRATAACYQRLVGTPELVGELVVVDGSGTPDEVAAAVRAAVDARWPAG